MAVSPATKRLVKDRSQGLCEYCRIPEEEFAAATSFHVEHIKPKSRFRDGDPLRDDPRNLAWACPKCNLPKSNKTQATDPKTGELHPLFNPRTEEWSDHFVALSSGRIEGVTPTGRATRDALNLNDESRVQNRSGLYERNKWP